MNELKPSSLVPKARNKSGEHAVEEFRAKLVSIEDGVLTRLDELTTRANEDLERIRTPTPPEHESEEPITVPVLPVFDPEEEDTLP